MVLDGVGGELGRGAFDLLGPGGRIVLFGFASGEITPFTSADLSARGPVGLVGDRPGDDRGPAGWPPSNGGRWRPPPTAGSCPWWARFPLAEAAAAHRAVESRDTIGKTVLVP